jgi:DNA-binding CsgD family transcriptional regulator
MSDDNTQANLDASIGRCELGKVGQLLAAVAQIADSHPDLLDRRTKLLERLVKLTSAAGGSWNWGVATDSAQSIAPVVSIEAGLSDSEMTALINTGLDATMFEEFRVPIMQRIQARSLPLATTARTDLFDDEAWKKTRMVANLNAGGLEEWLHSVRYSGEETWSSLFLMRRKGEAPFHSDDRQLIDLAMANIPWLGATLENTLPAESTVELTSRQRVVLLLQLDGHSRKQIASRLEISVDTVGDHIKKIHEHFDVSSAGELAALFLRKR